MIIVIDLGQDYFILIVLKYIKNYIAELISGIDCFKKEIIDGLDEMGIKLVEIGERL